MGHTVYRERQQKIATLSAKSEVLALFGKFWTRLCVCSRGTLYQLLQVLLGVAIVCAKIIKNLHLHALCKLGQVANLVRVAIKTLDLFVQNMILVNDPC